MSLLFLLLVYFVYVLFLFVIHYYTDLISSKDQYTKEELSNILPAVVENWKVLSAMYTPSGMLIGLAASSIIGLLIPFISSNWFVNSSILVIVLYLVIPFIKEQIDSSMVHSSDNIADSVVNFFSKNAVIILLGFGSGTGASLMYNWAQKKDIPFLWFLVNLVAVTVLMEILLKKELKER